MAHLRRRRRRGRRVKQSKRNNIIIKEFLLFFFVLYRKERGNGKKWKLNVFYMLAFINHEHDFNMKIKMERKEKKNLNFFQ